MTDLRKAAEAALEALTNCTSEYGHRCNRCDSEVDEGGKVAAALRAALAEPVQPVAWLYECQTGVRRGFRRVYKPDEVDSLTYRADKHAAERYPCAHTMTPLYAAPPQPKASAEPVQPVAADCGDVSMPRELIDRITRTLGAHIDEQLRLIAAPPQPREPAEHVRLPTSADEAAAMASIGVAWLQQHAPERLTPQTREPVRLTEEQMLECVRSVRTPAPMGLTRDSGPYEVTEPTWFLTQLVRAVEDAVLRAQGIEP